MQGEDGASAGAFARAREGPAHLGRQVGGAVQADAVPVWVGGEARREDAREVLGRDPDAVVANAHAEPLLAFDDGARQLDPDAAAAAPGRNDGPLRVRDQVREDLKGAVGVDSHWAEGGEVALHADPVALERVGHEQQRLVGDDGRIDLLEPGPCLPVGLLRLHDLPDVLDGGGQGLQLLACVLVLG